MCISATASFGASIVLIPVGIYCVKKAASLEKPYWILALLPFIFGIQQIFEGLVWSGIDTDGQGTTRLAALGFIFFSHVFWLFWVPFSCYAVENNAVKRKAFLTLSFFGATVGLLMYIPLWIHEHWLVIEVVNQSIFYNTTLLYDSYVSKTVGRVIYALIILVPLLLASDRHIKIFGIVIAVSATVFSIFFEYAFVSIWCFFSAVLSFFILAMILYKTRRAENI
jgi:hypothetical protein